VKVGREIPGAPVGSGRLEFCSPSRTVSVKFRAWQEPLHQKLFRSRRLSPELFPVSTVSFSH
jgi:hypothetical protein